MIRTLTIEVEFDETVTDADSVGEAVDRLLETAMSTPGILDEYGNPRIGQTYILGDERNVSPLAAKRKAASDELQHAAVHYGEVLHEVLNGVSGWEEVDDAQASLHKRAREYHLACCATETSDD